MKQHGLTGKEIAVRRTEDAWRYMLHRLPDPDNTLHNSGTGLEALRQLTFDPHVYAAMQQRVAGTTFLKWKVNKQQGTDEAAQLISDVMQNVDVEKLIPQILDAVFFGFSALEIIWQEQGGLLLPVRIEEKPQEWFFFDEQNKLRYRSDKPEGIVVPGNKFLLVQHGATYANPYGEKALSRCYWAVQFKQNGYRFWVTFVERYGMPFLAARQPRSYTTEEAEQLLTALGKMMEDTFGVIPDDSSVEFVQSSQSSTSEVYSKFLNFCNSEISKALVSQTLTTEVQEKGSYAAAKTHHSVLRHLTMGDKRLVEKTLTELIDLVMSVNFSNTSKKYYPGIELYAEDDTNKSLADRDRILRRQGVLFTREYYMRKYNLQEDEFVMRVMNYER